ncbi:Zinc transporter ZupT [Sporotomaculum syntrophicum]|uniref:Zinc transporter ZupT n=1 Tax=Sporotomaculum syntrophicum TaxID=182264 RepID=A0A9D2WNB9_9FIRM|nr:zinc transporter ZupT [Sporotomaculum syntrophicum]KAF1084444.1 Zinc transporter ZupT [Sporotomaculum syntrophicum]
METQNVLLAFGLTLFAGLCTGIGGLLTLFWKETNTKFLSFVLGLSAGVMVFLSFIEFFPQAKHCLTQEFGGHTGAWLTTVAFFSGVFLIWLIDRLVPSPENPHEIHKVEEMNGIVVNIKERKLLRTGVLIAIAVIIHNFPEGVASFIAVVTNPSLGIVIAAAIAIHNIPEGIAVAVPVYAATGNKKKACLMSIISGLAEPFGALIGFMLFSLFFNDAVLGVLFAAVAGIMVFISFDELLPSAEEYGHHHLSIFGLIGGMMVMSLSLLLLGD